MLQRFRYQRIGLHETLLVRRFDRKVMNNGVERSLFAGAATAPRLDSSQTLEDPQRSYVRLAHGPRRVAWICPCTSGHRLTLELMNRSCA